ncbi:pilus assembly protein PilP [Imbroritus primus]|uniref:Pilus assembly protein PilP n=1 Tax=Imbroritus primus TaxID=3058603 RepID=A0ACD3SSN7_9BURK|nr:pilus assembly protein PilP [Burkholderiaceae bacterium PBA]
MRARTLTALCALCLLAACGSREDELRAWMQQTRTAPAPRPAPLPEAKPYEAIEYKAQASVEPFSQRKIGELNRSFSESPDGMRQREPLEDYPLENFQLQGVMRKGGQAHAIVVVDGKAHQVRVGQHIGQNYGRIVRITENEVALRELVQEGAGEWKERMSTLKMQESR